MGCHSGFNVHDSHAAGGNPLDFAQALARRGAWWIGNTGYGYGMDDSIAFHEQGLYLVLKKVMIAPPLYGLPMQRVSVPNPGGLAQTKAAISLLDTPMQATALSTITVP